MNQSKVLEKLTNSYPSISLMAGDTFYWSPNDKTVYYKPDNQKPEGIWALLHETGHALLKHERYYTDVELVTMEMEAWEKAKELASELQKDLGSESLDLRQATQERLAASKIQGPKSKIYIDEDHIQDCLDSYRDWLHKRSLCPDCHLSGIQTQTDTYSCVFCHKKWKVSSDRFCRPYRKALKK